MLARIWVASRKPAIRTAPITSASTVPIPTVTSWRLRSLPARFIVDVSYGLASYFGSSKRIDVRTGTSTGAPFAITGSYFQRFTAAMAGLSNTPGGVASMTRTSRGSPLASTVYSTVTAPLTRCDNALLGNSGGTYRVRFRLAANEAGLMPEAAAARAAADEGAFG